MKKIYLVKKDPTKDGQDNWITMNGYEFAQFIKTPEGQARRKNFGQLDACGDDDDIIVIECGPEAARELRAEKDYHDYLKEQETEFGYTTFSYSTFCSKDGEITGEDILADEKTDVETSALLNIQIDELHKAIDALSEKEKCLVYNLFLSPDPLTEEEYAEQFEIKRCTVSFYKRRVLGKLREILNNKK